MEILKTISAGFLFFVVVSSINAQSGIEKIYPSRTEKIVPLRKSSFNNNNECSERRQGGNARTVNGYKVFDGAQDGYRQVDPQIAVGKNYILHGTNNGFVVYDKNGNYKSGVTQKCFNDGIDPKMFYDVHNDIYVFDLWWYYDAKKEKPVNISVSETGNPLGAWNTYPISLKDAVDGGGIGFSRQWIAYSFPGGKENTLIMRTGDAKAGKPVTVYHFDGSLGHPVFTQDALDELYFLEIKGNNFIIRRVKEDVSGNPYCEVVSDKPHNLKYINYPPPSPQKGTDQKVSSGDRNPKNLVLQNGHIWFSHAVNCENRSAVQWHQIDIATSTIVQTGIIKSQTSNYIQTTIAVNKKNDVLVGFQEVNERMYISPRIAYRNWNDPNGYLSDVISLGEGKGATDGMSWGDYSGSVIDGDNLSDLWTVQSITNDKGKGETIIAKVPFTKKRGFWWWLFNW